MFTIHVHVDLNLCGFKRVFAYKVAHYFILLVNCLQEAGLRTVLLSYLPFRHDLCCLLLVPGKLHTTVVQVDLVFNTRFPNFVGS